MQLHVRAWLTRAGCALGLLVAGAGAYFEWTQTAAALRAVSASAVWFGYERGESISAAGWQAMADSGEAALAVAGDGQHLPAIADGYYGVFATQLNQGVMAAELAEPGARALTAIDAALRRWPASYRLWINRAVVLTYLGRPAYQVAEAVQISFLTGANAGRLDALRRWLCDRLAAHDGVDVPTGCVRQPGAGEAG